MTTETIGGECPNCDYNKMIMRYGKEGALQIDACPRCEFAYGHNDTEELKGYDLWDVLIGAMKDRLQGLGYQPSIAGIRRFAENYDMPLSERKSVFDYSNGLPYVPSSDYSKLFRRCKELLYIIENKPSVEATCHARATIHYITGKTDKNPLLLSEKDE